MKIKNSFQTNLIRTFLCLSFILSFLLSFFWACLHNVNFQDLSDNTVVSLFVSPRMKRKVHFILIHFNFSSRQNYYQQLTNPAGPGPNASSFILNLQIGFGDRVDGLAIGRPHPISIYDLQTELQQRYNIPILEQNVSYNGMPLTQLPPDASLETVGIGNNSFISLWYRPPPSQFQQQQPMMNDYNSSRQGPPQSVYPDSFPMLRPADGSK